MSNNPFSAPSSDNCDTQSLPAPRRPRKSVSMAVLLGAVVVAWVTTTSDQVSELLTPGVIVHRYHVALVIFGYALSAMLLTSAFFWWRGRVLVGMATIGIVVVTFAVAPGLLFAMLFP